MGGSISDLVPELQPFARDLVDAAGRAGLQPRVTSTIRSYSEQRRLYNRFLAGQAGYPVAPPGQSAHEYGLAFDMVVSPMEALADVGYTWQQWGGGWNGSDAVHFELPGSSAWARLQTSEDQSGSKIAGYINSIFLGVGPVSWLTGITAADVLKKAVAVEKSLGFDAAVDWFWRHVAVNPDAPK